MHNSHVSASYVFMPIAIVVVSLSILSKFNSLIVMVNGLMGVYDSFSEGVDYNRKLFPSKKLWSVGLLHV